MDLYRRIALLRSEADAAALTDELIDRFGDPPMSVNALILVALLRGEEFPAAKWIGAALVLGFVAYGLSIFLYVRAQSTLGAARTSAYYAVAPFIGAALSFAFLREKLSALYLAALAVMIAGTVLVVVGTLKRRHTHLHTHTITHTHDGSTHTHTITHEHPHNHYLSEDEHRHKHLLSHQTED